jgi:hypothetical protein
LTQAITPPLHLAPCTIELPLASLASSHSSVNAIVEVVNAHIDRVWFRRCASDPGILTEGYWHFDSPVSLG